MQLAPQIRTLQITVSIVSGTAQQQAFAAACGHILTQTRVVKGQVNGIPCLGVGELKIQLGVGRQTGAGAAQRNARRRQAS